MQKIVNGVAVDLSADEIAARQAEELAWAGSRAAAQALQMLETKRLAALKALEDQRLAAATLDPAAPQPVKDYAAAVAAAPPPKIG